MEEVKTKIMLSKDLLEMEAIKYLAFRYDTTPVSVLEHYFVQCGIISTDGQQEAGFSLTPNEIALLRDLGVQPSLIEIK